MINQLETWKLSNLKNKHETPRRYPKQLTNHNFHTWVVLIVISTLAAWMTIVLTKRPAN